MFENAALSFFLYECAFCSKTLSIFRLRSRAGIPKCVFPETRVALGVLAALVEDQIGEIAIPQNDQTHIDSHFDIRLTFDISTRTRVGPFTRVGHFNVGLMDCGRPCDMMTGTLVICRQWRLPVATKFRALAC